MFINVSDFTGVYLLAKDTYNVGEIQKYIDQFEKPYLSKLLGATLAQELIDDSGSGVPVDPLLLDIFNPFERDSGCKVLSSIGIVNYLLGCVYYEYVVAKRLSPSIVGGAAQNKVETANIATSRSEVFNRYNESMKSGKVIQEYILENIDDYPSFNGQKLLLTY
jgi:hypothetical protein